jgi:hypothetical protein
MQDSFMKEEDKLSDSQCSGIRILGRKRLGSIGSIIACSAAQTDSVLLEHESSRAVLLEHEVPR